ncbi:MAG: hypothetical protein V1778_01205 [bacterium]
MMFETPPSEPRQPMNEPPPVQPLRPFGSPLVPPSVPPSPSAISPERMPSVPLPSVPPSVPPRRTSGGKGRRTLLIVVLAVVLLGGGVAVAAVVFPRSANTENANITNGVRSNSTVAGNATTNRSNLNLTNRLTNALANSSTLNSNAASNISTTNSQTNSITNSGNTNTPLTNGGSTNVTSNSTLANSALNSNAATNATNVSINANTNSSLANTPPSTYTTDTDGDKLNDYLEEWVGTSKTNADSDGDGFPDGSEVINKFSPLGSGKMTAAGLQTYCSRSTVVLQYGLSSTDVSTLCGISGDVLSSIQVMATNSAFYEDLSTKLTNSCSAFGKLDSKVCAGLVRFLIVDYLASGSSS